MQTLPLKKLVTDIFLTEYEASRQASGFFTQIFDVYHSDKKMHILHLCYTMKAVRHELLLSGGFFETRYNKIAATKSQDTQL